MSPKGEKKAQNAAVLRFELKTLVTWTGVVPVD